MMRFGFVAEDGGHPSTYYRCAVPLAGLRRLGHECWLTRMFTLDDGTLSGRRGFTGLVHRPGSTEAAPRSADVIVLRAYTENIADEIAEARDAGQVVLFDLDDDLWHRPPMDDAGLDLDAVTANIDAVDGVLAATAPLAEVVRTVTTTPVHVARAGIDTEPYRPHADHRPLRLGWLGHLGYRRPDFEQVAPVVAGVVKMFATATVEFHWIGCTEAAELKVMRRLMPGVDVHHHPWRPIWQLADALDAIDLAVVPVTGDAFGRARSATTGLALAAAGVPFVASPTPAYLELAEQGAGWIAGDLGEWRSHLVELATRPAVRAAAGAHGRAAVVMERNPAKVARDWLGVATEHGLRARGRAKMRRP